MKTLLAILGLDVLGAVAYSTHGAWQVIWLILFGVAVAKVSMDAYDKSGVKN